MKIVQKNNCLTGTGVAEKSPEGNYTCRVIKNTKKKLVVKMAGISKKSIGILSPATSNPAYLAGWLVCKKAGERKYAGPCHQRHTAMMGKNGKNGFLEYLYSTALVVYKNEGGAEETDEVALVYWMQ